MRALGRGVAIAVGFVLLLVGAYALGRALLPEHAVLETARAAVLAGCEAVPGLPGDASERLHAVLGHPALAYGLLPVGLVVLVTALLPRRRLDLSADPDELLRAGPPVNERERKRTRRRALALAKRGQAQEAADLLVGEGLLDDAAKVLLEAGDRVRAAEVRHDQNRFLEAAELYVEAEAFEEAASIFSHQGEWARAAECYARVGNTTVAAEAFEKAGSHRRAAECYEKAGFLREAAQAYAHCEAFEPAARCLEALAQEEGAGASGAARAGEVQRVVRAAGQYYERAGRLDRAEAVLTRGECYGEAGELARRQRRFREAAELFLRAQDLVRAAEALEQAGASEEACRIRAEHHRRRGEEREAAACYERAGDLMEAGDIYRSLDDPAAAAACYERFGDAGQAAEMYRAAGDRDRAAAAYEKAGRFAEAAECAALAGDGAREADLLARAGQHLRAGQAWHREGRDDDAIAVLQQVGPDDPDHRAACALKGELFLAKGEHALARAALEPVVDAGSPVDRDGADAAYALAAAYDAEGDPERAASLYERIRAFDYRYRDVEERLRAAREARDAARAAAAAAERTQPATGRPGRYRITGKLGRGGMGIVYKAEDTVLDRVVAFKVLPDALRENPQALKNFLREAKSAAQLNHPGIVTVYDAGEQDGAFYIAMEYVDGTTLKEIVKRRGRISASGIVHVLSQMCEALAYAHDKRIVHRDIKTANTMWTRDKKAKIMDFGLAKVVEEVRNHTTVVSGTPYYMSPEQTLGKNVDHRTDLYSLGVTVFELATAQLPFTEGNIPYHHVHTPPPDPRELCPDVPELLARIVARCLKKSPDERYASASEILAELKSALRA